MWHVASLTGTNFYTSVLIVEQTDIFLLPARIYHLLNYLSFAYDF